MSKAQILASELQKRLERGDSASDAVDYVVRAYSLEVSEVSAMVDAWLNDDF